MKKKLLAGIRLLFFLGLGLFFIWLFLHNLTPEQKDEIVHSLGRANYFWIAVSIFIGILSHASRARRWVILLGPLGYKPRYRNVLMATFIGYFANLVFPRLGEVSRCGVLTRYENIPFNQSFGTVIAERALDMAVFLVLFFLNLALQFSHIRIYVDQRIYTPLYVKFEAFGDGSLLKWFIAAAFIVALLLLVMFRRRFYHLKIVLKIKDMATGFLGGIRAVFRMKHPVEFVLHTIFIWICYFLMAWVVFLSLPETAGLGILAGLAVLVFGSIGIILVQGGIGVYPAIVAETLVLYGIVSTTGYAMGWLLWSAQTIMIIVMGALSMLLLPLINKSSYGFGIFTGKENI